MKRSRRALAVNKGEKENGERCMAKEGGRAVQGREATGQTDLRRGRASISQNGDE